MNRTNENSLAKLSVIHEQVIVDEATTKITYVGFSAAGIATSSPYWIIIKIESANASAPYGVTTIKYATSYNSNTNIWDNRASLSYTS